MSTLRAAERLTIYLTGTDHRGRVPLYVEVVDRARRAGLAGATVVEGVQGYGSSARVHERHIASAAREVPVVVTVVDEPDRLDDFLAEISPLLESAVVRRNPVRLVQLGQ